MATTASYPEPNERWKAQLKSRIDENLQNLLQDAKASYEQGLNETRPDASMARRKLYLDYLQTTENLKMFAADEYAFAVEREKQEMEWCLKAQAPEEVDPELEALKEEQFAILHAIRDMETASASAAFTNPDTFPTSSNAQYEHHKYQFEADHTEGYYPFAVVHERQGKDIPRAARGMDTNNPTASPYFESPARTSAQYQDKMKVLIEADHEDDYPLFEHEEQEMATRGMETNSNSDATTFTPTPTRQPQPSAQRQQNQSGTAHGDPYGFYNFASLSPLFTPAHLDSVSESSAETESQFESESEAEPQSEYYEDDSDDDGDDDESDGPDSDETDSRTPSPSPPSTPPPALSTPVSTTSCTAVFFQVPKAVVDEEARLRAERQAQQQEEFHKRAEEIRKKNMEKQKLKEQPQRWELELPTPSEISYFSPYSSSDEDTRFTSSSFFSSSASTSTSSASTSTPASSCNSPHPSTSVLEPSPMCEEDKIRLFIFHDQQWTRISSYHSLQWSDFPWPILNFIGPRSERELSMDAISDYILSAFDCSSQNQPQQHKSLLGQRQREHERQQRLYNKERLREHIRKWHPDRFESRFLALVSEEKGERERVRAGAGLVVRHLTELLGRFNDV